jgi:hypothetical protein
VRVARSGYGSTACISCELYACTVLPGLPHRQVSAQPGTTSAAKRAALSDDVSGVAIDAASLLGVVCCAIGAGSFESTALAVSTSAYIQVDVAATLRYR